VNDSSYFRYSGTKPGWLRIRLSRQGFPSSPVHVLLGRITVVQRTPVLAGVTRAVRSTIESGVPRTIWLRVPASGFGVRVVVDDKFVPNQVDPHSGDPRTLGALVDYRFFTKLPRNAKPSKAG